MNYKINLKCLVVVPVFIFICFNSFSQETPNIKYLNPETIDKFQVDIDQDGDLDLIVAGVFIEKNQGRVYVVRNKGKKFDKPDYVYSYPTIGLKQELIVSIKNNKTIITTTGTSPTGERENYTATLDRGKLEGLTIPPVSSNSKK